MDAAVAVRFSGADGLTTMPPCVAVRPEASVTVTDWLPAVLRVTAKVCRPASAAVKV